MSTGAECWFDETEPGVWTLALENNEGTRLDPEFDEYTIRGTLADAERYLRDHFANPGGYSVMFHPESTDPERNR